MHPLIQFLTIPFHIPEYVADVSTAATGGNTGSHLQLNLNNASEIMIAANKVTLIGLIVNELITNSIKHAFQGSDLNTITIHLEKEAVAQLSLSFEENGIGKLHGNITAGSFGVNMIQQLVKQMKGSIIFNNNNSNKVNIYYPSA